MSVRLISANMSVQHISVVRIYVVRTYLRTYLQDLYGHICRTCSVVTEQVLQICVYIYAHKVIHDITTEQVYIYIHIKSYTTFCGYVVRNEDMAHDGYVIRTTHSVDMCSNIYIYIYMYIYIYIYIYICSVLHDGYVVQTTLSHDGYVVRTTYLWICVVIVAVCCTMDMSCGHICRTHSVVRIDTQKVIHDILWMCRAE